MRQLVICVIVGLTQLLFLVQCQVDERITPNDSSVPPCPSSGSRTFLRHKSDGQCYEANSKGPCGVNMILFPHPDNKNYAFCDCFDARRETTEEAEHLTSRTLSHCVPEIRGQVFVPERNRCYSVFDQGPCAAGKWLVLNSTFYPICAKNTCENKVSSVVRREPLSPKFTFAISSKSECFQTGTRGHCAESYQLRFSSNHFIPQCRYIPTQLGKCPPPPSPPPIRKLQCKPGSRYDFLTKCTSSINPR